MSNPFRTLDDADVSGKRVLLRVRPQCSHRERQGDRHDPDRARRLHHSGNLEQGRQGHPARPFRPAQGAPNETYSLWPVAAAVSEIVKRPVAFATDSIGKVAADAITRMKNGDILLLENTRFYKGEEKNDPAHVEELAKLGDVYVNDAFSAAHRAHASTEGVAHKLPAYCGRAMQSELEALTIALSSPERPVAAIVGGAKVSTKLELLGNLIKKVDVLIIGGGMANTFLFAEGKGVGNSLCEKDMANKARSIMAEAQKGRLPHCTAGRCGGGQGAQGACECARGRRRPSRRGRDDARHRAEVGRRR